MERTVRAETESTDKTPASRACFEGRHFGEACPGSSVEAFGTGRWTAGDEKGDDEQENANRGDGPEFGEEATQGFNAGTFDRVGTETVSKKPNPGTECEKQQQREQRKAEGDATPKTGGMRAVLLWVHGLAVDEVVTGVVI
jgi:hypothetical protein